MTTTQLSLNLEPLVHRPVDARLSLSERFAQFHADNPSVADLFEQLAEQWFAAGNQRVGLKFLAEQARWISGLQMPGEAWAVNNSYTAFYARVLLARRPQWTGRILTRRAVADGAVA